MKRNEKYNIKFALSIAITKNLFLLLKTYFYLKVIYMKN